MILHENNLNGHWDAMDFSSIQKDDSNFVDNWLDRNQHYNLKASGENRPKYVLHAINSLAAIDFTGANVGLVSIFTYSNGPNDPFTWIMAVKPSVITNQGHGNNIFSTSDNNWNGLNINRPDFHPVSASTNGIHAWASQLKNSIVDQKLPVNKLTILTIKYDGKEASVYWDMNKMATITPDNAEWGRGPIGYISMGLGLQNANHDYSGFIAEVLAYNVALESPILDEMIEAMSTKWTTGKQWKKSGLYFPMINANI